MSRTPAPAAKGTDAAPPRRVSHRHDPTERQADRAADIVARGGSVTGWSFASVPAEASVHRDEDRPKKLEDKPRPQEEAYKEGAGKAAEAFTKTETGEGVIETVKKNPALLTAAAGGLLLGGKDVPIPLSDSLTLGVRAEGITDAFSADTRPAGGFPLTYAGVSLSYEEKGPRRKSSAQREKEKIAADTARLRNDPIIKGLSARQDKELSDAAIASVVARQRFAPAGQLPGLPLPLVPSLTPTGGKAATEQKKPEDAVKAEEQKKRDDVQRAPVTTSEDAQSTDHDTTGVDAATRGGGRALDPSLRHSMEARFGHDFSSVRLHDDPQAASAAAGVDAKAFTIGEDIVFGTGRFDPSSPEGRHLIAHELAHVVQQRAGAGARTTGAPTRIHRLDAGNWFALLFGGEGSWTEQELRSYLLKITAARRHEGWWESDNKARAIVRKFMAGTPGWDLLSGQKALLIDEMLDGSVLDADEEGILDLLETAGATDLATIFRDPRSRFHALDDAIDGAEHERLLAFADRRFARGSAGLRAGEASVASDRIPRGAPAFPFEAADLEQRLDGEDRAEEILARLERMSTADRQKAFDYLRDISWPRAADDYGKATKLLGEVPADQLPAVKARQDAADLKLRKLKTVVGRDFISQLPATRDLLASQTSPIAADKRDELTLALAPKTYDTSEGNVIDLDIVPPQATAPAPKATPAPPAAPQVSSVKKGPAQERADARRADAEKKAAQEEAERRFGDRSAYRRDLEAAIRKVIDSQYEKNVTAVGTRKEMSAVTGIAAAAERETNAVFGAYYRKKSDPPADSRRTEKIHGLTVESDKVRGNVRSWFAEYDSTVRPLDPATRRRFAINWLRRYYQSETEIRTVNGAHGAKPAFDANDVAVNVEAKTQKLVAEAVTVDGTTVNGLDDPKTIADKLLVIKRNWVGMAGDGEVWVNLFETGDVEKDRAARWTMLQVLVHEYVHTLRHADYEAYAKSFGPKSVQYNTLVEGVDEVFAAMVWARMSADLAALRPEVEGPVYAQLPMKAVPPPTHYDSIAEAYRIVAIAGLPSLAAAYFLGKVDRIRPTGSGAGR